MQIKTRPTFNDLTEFNAQLTIHSSPENFVDFIKEPNNLGLWLDNIKSAKVKLITPKQNELTVHFNSVWPIAERIMKIKSTIEVQTDRSILIQVTDMGNELDTSDNAITVTVHSAHWLISPLGNNKSQVTYQFIANINGNVPQWLANRLTLHSTWKSLNKIKQLLNKPYSDKQSMN